jgi:hypothetical protein
MPNFSITHTYSSFRRFVKKAAVLLSLVLLILKVLKAFIDLIRY